MQNTLYNRINPYVLWLMIFAVGLFNVADYFFTLHFLSLGMREGNPVMDMIVGTAYFPTVKLGLVPLALFFLWNVREKIGRRIYGYVGIAFVAYLMLMVYYMWLFWSFYS